MPPLFALLARKLAPLARWAFVWWVPTCIALYVKNQMMGGDGLAIAARAVGKIEIVKGGEADWLASFALPERLSFYRGELLWGLLILPALSLLLTSGRNASRWRGTILAGASIILSCLLYAELLSLRAVGRMLSMTLASDALSFANCCAPTARQYFGVRGAFQLAVLALLTVGLSCWASRRNRKEEAGDARCTAGSVGALGLWGLAFAVTFAAWLPWLPFVSFHTSVLETAVKTFAFEKGLDTSAYAGLSLEELTRRYRELTNTPAPREDARYWAKTKDCDVLVFVLETAPARCLPIEGDLSDCPNLARLRERAFVATRHHTAYPYTSRAVFSILSSWYPSTLMKNFSQRHPNLVYSGLMQSLKAVGYQTALYAPDSFRVCGFDTMFHDLGIERHVYIGSDEGQGRYVALSSAEADLQERLRQDRACLQVLKSDMHAWRRSDQKFAALFLPQIGHGPWLDFTGGAAADDLIARGRKLISLQDAWLGEILDQLAADARLEKTLIVVVGDHGVRTKREDPNFRPGMVDDYSFHVPLLIYAPGAVDERTDVQHITSHIDVAPSLLDLLGVRIGRDSEQGMPIWDQRLHTRNTYFPANHLFGSDGYCDADGKFYMWNHLNEAIYENSQLHFDTGNLVPKRSRRYEEIKQHLMNVFALQEVWASSRCCTNNGDSNATALLPKATNRSTAGPATR
jgi:glucan phosphoethanolaminetransferase (alkaline phosphatase superfamily)